MNHELINNAIVKYKTPAYLFDLDEMANRVGKFRKILRNEIGLCFAMKANPFLTSYMDDITDRIEVCSMGEFRICKELNLEGEKVLISGVLKKKEDLLEILEYYRGRCFYTAESLLQFQIISEWSARNKEKVSLFLRLTSQNQFGMDGAVIRNLIEMQESYPFTEIRGIHYFSGTAKKNIKIIEEELKYLDQFCTDLEKSTKYPVKEIEYGPGLSVPYFEGQKDTLEQDLAAIDQAIKNMKWRGKVTLEMGRALAASCGYYLTGVKEIKQNGGKNYCIVDGGMHHLHYDGQIRGIYRPHFSIRPEIRTGKEREWIICGELCTANDILMQNVFIKNLREGDIFIFENAGAYSMTEGMSLFLSHSLPKAVLYSRKKGWTLLREELPTYQWNMEKRR